MGMTDDFEVAVEEGATIVRVGRALFGERPHDQAGPRDQRPARRAGRLGPGERDDVRFAVRLTPGAVADRVDGVVDGVLRARVAAPAVAGAANHALVRLIAAELGVPRGACT